MVGTHKIDILFQYSVYKRNTKQADSLLAYTRYVGPIQGMLPTYTIIQYVQ